MELYMMESFFKIKEMERVFLFILMDHFTKENGKMESQMVRAIIINKLFANKREFNDKLEYFFIELIIYF